MNKQEQIELKKKKPIEVGDFVLVQVPYQSKEIKTEGRGKKKISVEVIKDAIFKLEGTVLEITDKGYKIDSHTTRIPFEISDILPSGYDSRADGFVIAKPEFVSPTFYDCGANNFCKIKHRISFYNQELASILFKAGYGRRNDDFNEMSGDKDWQKVNFNPFIIDATGERKFYQRDLVWTLEQKQLLIDSIYNDIEIGKFLFRYNSWTRMQLEEKETGTMHSWDCVDGKQRFFTILHFLQNKFPDGYGNYWSDLSGKAQQRFLNFANLSYGELSENASDQDVIDNFLTLNFTGTPMSQEHIDFVKGFNL